jgi:protease-4
MNNFLKYTLATVTGIIIAGMLFFVFLLASLSAIMSSGNKAVTIDENSILVLKAGIPVPERTSTNPFAGFDPVNLTFTPAPGLNDILKNIEKAAPDKKIKGILVENGLMTSGWGTTEEIRNALASFRSTGKFVISYTDYILNQEGYYLSTACDHIFANPQAMLEFKGLSGEVMFYRNALEKIGVDVQVIRHGKFKGAVEPFILDALSRENREQIKDYTGSIWSHVVSEISQVRLIPENQLNLIADKLMVTDMEEAYRNKLVDGLLYRDELIDTLRHLSGIGKNKKLRLVTMTKYSRVPDQITKRESKNKIAVIYAAGNIVMGDGNEANIGAERYSGVIREARLDSSIKAIVLRVNSPGGNATASELIWREMDLAARSKPVVISMGNYAASGGYYISAPATRIYTNPTTISGSIGVFGLLPDASRLLNQKLGITTETVNTNENSDFPSIFRPLSTLEKEVMQMSVEKTYADFVKKVAAGRKMDAVKIDSLGQGRVWSGSRLVELGLGDETGGLKDAVKGAAELAGIDNYTLKELPQEEDPYLKILSGLSGEIRLKLLQRELGKSFKYYSEIKELENLSGIQARLPYFIEIR